jgi:hypothetical protein
MNMLYRLTEKLKKEIYGRLERNLFGKREVIREEQTSSTRGSEVSSRSMVPRSNETKIPDPWFN